MLYSPPQVEDINVPTSLSNTLNMIFQLPDIINVPTLPSNIQTMVTHSIVGVFQPKVLVSIISINPILS